VLLPKSLINFSQDTKVASPHSPVDNGFKSFCIKHATKNKIGSCTFTIKWLEEKYESTKRLVVLEKKVFNSLLEYEKNQETDMETLKTLIVSTLVYSWIYGEKLYYFILGKEVTDGLRKMSRRN